MKNNTKIKIKKILKWFLILLFPLLFILWFFAWALIPVYIWLSFFIYGPYHLTNSAMEDVLSKEPKNLSELHILNQQYSRNRNWLPDDDYINMLKKSSKIDVNDIDFNEVKWFNKKYNKSDIAYVDTLPTQPRWEQANSSFGSFEGMETFYFLFDSELNLLGYYHKK